MNVIRLNLTALMSLIIMGAYLHIYHTQTIAQAVTVGVYIGAFVVIAAICGVGVFLWVYVGERVKIMRADRIARERDAHLTVIQNDKTGIVFTRDTDKAAIYHALHLEQKTYSNGHYQEPSQLETIAWHRFITAQAKTSTAAKVIDGEMLPALPNGEYVQPLDILNELDTVQRCLIVAPSNGGKTTLLQWIVSRRLTHSQVIVIDPHSYPEKWGGCDVVGDGRNYASIATTLDALIDLMTSRYAEIGRGDVGEGKHDKITIIIDEWRAIVRNVDNAADSIGALLTESRKAAFSVFMGTHSERVKALGLDGEGDLKDGFTMVRLGFYGGERVATIDYGKGEIDATLPGEYHSHEIASNAPKPFIIPDGPKVSNLEQSILDMREDGASYSAIAKEIYGGKGGKQIAQIKQVLAKFETI